MLMLSTIASAQGLRVLKQNYVLGFGIFLKLLKSPQELVWLGQKISDKSRLKKYTQGALDFEKAQEKSDENLCSQVCPNNFAIHSESFERMQPNTGEHLLDFLNEKSEFKGFHQRTLGYCYGHTTLQRKFNYLAVFDPDNKYGADIPNVEKERKWKRFYRKRINRIKRGKATVIPGFNNLREFCANPIIKKILKEKTVEEWRDNAARLGGVSLFLKGLNELNKKTVDKRVNDIRAALAVNITPKIYMTNSKRPMFMHIISVYDVIDDSDGSTRLCILDNHQYEDQLIGCQTYLRIYPDGRMFYPAWEEPERDVEGWVRHFGFTHENLREVIRFTKTKVKLCRELTECKRN